MNTQQTPAAEATQEWLHDHQIVVFSLTSVNRSAIDAYTDLIKDAMVTWPPDKPFLAVYDFSAPNLHISPYMRQRVREMSKLKGSQNACTAIVVSGFLIPLASLIMNVLPQRASNQRRIFSSRAEAMTWLESKLPG
jgi:hypothetical protein